MFNDIAKFPAHYFLSYFSDYQRVIFIPTRIPISKSILTYLTQVALGIAGEYECNEYV